MPRTRNVLYKLRIMKLTMTCLFLLMIGHVQAQKEPTLEEASLYLAKELNTYSVTVMKWAQLKEFPDLDIYQTESKYSFSSDSTLLQYKLKNRFYNEITNEEIPSGEHTLTELIRGSVLTDLSELKPISSMWEMEPQGQWYDETKEGIPKEVRNINNATYRILLECKAYAKCHTYLAYDDTVIWMKSNESIAIDIESKEAAEEIKKIFNFIISKSSENSVAKFFKQ